MRQQTLEERVSALEAEFAQMKNLVNTSTKGSRSKRGWRGLVGVDANNPYFEAAMQAGREWRETEPAEVPNETAS